MSSQLLYKIQRKTIGTSYFSCIRILLVASLVAQLVKNPPAMQDSWVRSLGWEDPLEKGTAATHSSILAWRILWTIVHGIAKSQTRLSNFHVNECQVSY